MAQKGIKSWSKNKHIKMDEQFICRNPNTTDGTVLLLTLIYKTCVIRLTRTLHQSPRSNRKHIIIPIY